MPTSTQVQTSSATPPVAPTQTASPQAAGPRGDEDGELAAGFALALAKMAALATETGRMTGFHAVRAPGMSLPDYMARIHQFFGCSGPCYVLALIFIDRLIKRHPDIVISSLCSHRLLLISTMVAAKFHDDVFYSNAYYAKVGGVQLQEMNALEMRLLSLLAWKLRVLPEEYNVYRDMCKAAAQGAPSFPTRHT